MACVPPIHVALAAHPHPCPTRARLHSRTPPTVPAVPPSCYPSSTQSPQPLVVYPPLCTHHCAPTVCHPTHRPGHAPHPSPPSTSPTCPLAAQPHCPCAPHPWPACHPSM